VAVGGGWGKQGSGVPLSDRVRGGMARESGPPACPARHCWVSDAVDGLGPQRPGLLVEWRQSRTGWEGRVVYAVSLRPGEWCLVEEWLPAPLLTPV
jgi:hypothetical protein